MFYLPDEMTLECDVLSGFVWKRRWDDVCHPLGFMENGVSVRKVFPVCHLNLTVSYDSSQLFLNFVLLRKKTDPLITFWGNPGLVPVVICCWSSLLAWRVESFTLWLWELGHEEERPPQRRGGGLSTSSKQVEDGYEKVFIMKLTVGNSSFLHTNRAAAGCDAASCTLNKYILN